MPFFLFPPIEGACIVLHFRPLPLPDCLFAFLPLPSPSPSRFLHSSHFVSFPLFFISSPSLLSLITLLTIIFPVCPAPFPIPSYSFTILNLFLVIPSLTSSFPFTAFPFLLPFYCLPSFPLFVSCPFFLLPMSSHSSSAFLPSHKITLSLPLAFRLLLLFPGRGGVGRAWHAAVIAAAWRRC